ncbi:hypothetical protein PF005_g16932 [Phytophthora fragariae]|uniref:Uncharacterized protein n=1 Tax=Phytophthora fragariae TaxID=53985 RepID=A0A6A3R3E7_9STRA|nr:hypothetical protein PF007_g19928 [Phytophthora fragariae]KAE9196306.1 hypothetical protein PF005_g16932 [Phytophthora fragariae]
MPQKVNTNEHNHIKNEKKRYGEQIICAAGSPNSGHVKTTRTLTRKSSLLTAPFQCPSQQQPLCYMYHCSLGC